MEEGAAASSAPKDDFNKADESRSEEVDDVLGGFSSDSDGNEEQNPYQGFSTKNGIER